MPTDKIWVSGHQDFPHRKGMLRLSPIRDIIVNGQSETIHEWLLVSSPYFRQLLDPDSPYQQETITLDVDPDGWRVTKAYLYWHVDNIPRRYPVWWFITDLSDKGDVIRHYTDEQLALAIMVMDQLQFTDELADLLIYLDMTGMTLEQLDFFAAIPPLQPLAAASACAMYSLDKIFATVTSSPTSGSTRPLFMHDLYRRSSPNFSIPRILPTPSPQPMLSPPRLPPSLPLPVPQPSLSNRPLLPPVPSLVPLLPTAYTQVHKGHPSLQCLPPTH